MALSEKDVLRLGIIGVRDFKGKVYTNKNYISQMLGEYLREIGRTPDNVSIVIGGSRGVESLVCEWAAQNEIPLRKTLPNIEQHGVRKAFVVRNNSIVADCHELIVFWDGFTEFVAEAVMTATILKKKTIIYPLT